MSFIRWTFAVGVLTVATANAAIAQSTAPEPTSQSEAQKPLSKEGIPPCPTFDEQRAALRAPTTASGTPPPAAQRAERSGILPSAGGPGLETSSAPTVSGEGHSVRSSSDCPLVPEHPNALPPGPNRLPDVSKDPNK